MLDPKDFKKHSDPVVAWIDHYLNDITKFPVKARVAPGEIYKTIPQEAPLFPEAMEKIMEDLDNTILPGITHWQHPGFHAYFPANSSVESVLAECITSAIGAQCMIWDTSPAAAELEQRMVEWLRDAMGIPSDFEGVIQDSASSASLVALITAREVATGFRSNEEGVPNNLRIYCSTETHSSIEKAVGVCGIGKRNLVKVETDTRMQMDPSLLGKAIKQDLERGMKPCAVVATLGTTGTLAVDPLKEIAALCKKHGIWLHVDAAYAGTALLLSEYRWMIEGIEEVDSFVFNPHKWMFTNFDCSVYFVKDAPLLIKTFEVLPEYLKTKSRGRVNDYRDWSVPLGRRFRALKLWFVIRSYGLEGIREKLREHIRLSNFFVETLTSVEGLVMPVEPFLNFSCFRLQPDGITDPVRLNPLNEAFLEEINRSGELYLTHTKIDGFYTIRMIIGQTYVGQKHVELALERIKKAALSILNKFGQNG
ncbi:MAG: aminotransferase class I/II-fold pyridoxal phosphate-dependent enzyme [Bacteroidia bacterium]|nr:MAG: aminotransferase class I/II-fold pyridoxal phosphate-dependent enzyme [Bacteroidia bacterium]